MDVRERDKINYEALSETELQDKLTLYFSKYFVVDIEVRSNCSKARIDFLMFHNTDTIKLYPIGIELKKTDIKRGADIGRWCKQAEKYTVLFFKTHQPTVFITPQITGWYLTEGERMHPHNPEEKGSIGCQNNVNSFLYKAFGIGELQQYYDHSNKKQLRFVVNTYEIWSSENPREFNHTNYLKCR